MAARSGQRACTWRSNDDVVTGTLARLAVESGSVGGTLEQRRDEVGTGLNKGDEREVHRAYVMCGVGSGKFTLRDVVLLSQPPAAVVGRNCGDVLVVLREAGGAQRRALLGGDAKGNNGIAMPFYHAQCAVVIAIEGPLCLTFLASREAGIWVVLAGLYSLDDARGNSCTREDESQQLC